MRQLLTPELAEALRAGEITFQAFLRETSAEWVGTSEWLMRRWRHRPTYVTAEDLAQELMMGAYKGFREWDPKYGNPLHKHMRFAALHGAMRWMHVQRNSLRRDGKAPGRWEIPFTSMVRTEDGSLTADDFPAPDQVFEAPELEPEVEAERLLASQARRERLGVTSFAEALEVARLVEEWIQYAGEQGPEEAVESAALAILGDPERACLLRVSDYRQARAAVLGCVRDFAESA